MTISVKGNVDQELSVGKENAFAVYTFELIMCMYYPFKNKHKFYIKYQLLPHRLSLKETQDTDNSSRFQKSEVSDWGTG